MMLVMQLMQPILLVVLVMQLMQPTFGKHAGQPGESGGGRPGPEHVHSINGQDDLELRPGLGERLWGWN